MHYPALQIACTERTPDRGALMCSAEQAQLAMLSGLLRTLLTLVRVRMNADRLTQLSHDIEAIARRNGWTSAADFASCLGAYFSEIDTEAYGDMPATIVEAVEAAALHPRKDWMPIVMAMRIAVGAQVERRQRHARDAAPRTSRNC